MNKPKIYELAKELNVTSKRLIEKLNEIDIYPKSHMTTLEKDEVDKLYKHIGVVRHTNNEDDASHNDAENKAKQAEAAAKRNAPRIIRKTEVIIHDDIPVQETNDKKERKGFVRSSESNDGLMAGFTRGRDSIVTNIRKHTKPKEAPKETPKEVQNEVQKDVRKEEQKPVLRNETELSSNKLKKPVDDILSIKKVSHMSKKTESTVEINDVEEQENMQKESIVVEKPQVQLTEPNEKVTKKADKAEASEKKSTEKAEKAVPEEKVRSDEDIRKSINVKNEPHQQAHGESKPAAEANVRKEQHEAGGRHENRQEAGGQHEGSFRRESQNQQGQRRTNIRTRSNAGRESGYQGNSQNNFRPRDGARDNNRERPRSNAPQGGGYQGGYQGGGYQGGYQGGRQGGRQGDPRHHDRQGDRPYGNRPPYDRTGKPGDFRRDDRPSGNNRNGGRGLVIPKAAAPTGTTEEKVFTRGERRVFQTMEKQKAEKKELKKDVNRNVAGGAQKNSGLRRKIDTVVGHKANVSDMMSDDFVINTFYDDAQEAINAKRAERKLRRQKQKQKYIPPKAVLTDITIEDEITVKDLAEALKKTAAEVIKHLFLNGITATQNETVDFDTAVIIGEEFGVKVHKAVVISQEDILFDDSEDDPANLVPRAPVVVVMGHVDHGKTSLLDAIRSAHIAESEAGGITQHIGAYTVNLHGRDITFLDTPGHEAFTAMRARGAQVTDIAVLVVAADDGVMPQTIEAINHAKAAGVSIIVAINKIDKPNANQDRVKQELAEQGLLIEEWGGDVIAVPVSAKKHENIDQLLEMILLTADILELKTNPHKQAKGTVIEARLDKNKGPIATLLVQRGTLKVGDSILSGSTFGHIRSMTNDKGRKIKEAGPSIPVEIIGLPEVPEAGDIFYAVADEKVAKQLAEKRREESREKHIGRAKISLDDLFNQIQQGNIKELNLIVKADVQGSVEAICQSMEKLSNDEVKVNIIHSAVGSVIEADVTLAEVSNAIIIGFNVRPTANVTELAESVGVDIRLYRIIYDAIEDIEKAMKGMLDPTYKEVVDGHAEVRQLFKVSSVGTIAGSYVVDGKILRSSDVRLVRNGIVVFEGKLSSLKRFKDDAKEVAAGYECGVTLERFNDIKKGDVIESYHMEEVKRQ